MLITRTAAANLVNNILIMYVNIHTAALTVLLFNYTLAQVWFTHDKQ